MSLVTLLALVIVVLAALYLVALGAASFIVPVRAGRFLQGFASTPSLHYLELSMRLVVGAAFVQYAPSMLYPKAFSLFGWLLLITTAGLLLLPWKWHQRFARRVVSGSTRFLAAIGIGSLLLGAAVICAVWHGQAT